MSSDPDCLFCRIVAGETPAQLVWESERALAFRDLNPQAPKHVLVVPKAHHSDLGALTASDSAVLVGLLHGVAAVVEQEGLSAGNRVVFNTGTDGGQTVGHCHAHVLGGRQLGWPPG